MRICTAVPGDYDETTERSYPDYLDIPLTAIGK